MAKRHVVMDDEGSLGAAFLDPSAVDDVGENPDAPKPRDPSVFHARGRAFRKWRAGEPYHGSIPVPCPLILDGMVRVTSQLGGLDTSAIVSAEWTNPVADILAADASSGLAATATVEEQWLIFDGVGPTVPLLFNPRALTSYQLSLQPSAYGHRLPWPRKDYPSGPATTFWYPVSWGENVKADGFHAAIKIASGANQLPKHRYVWAQMAVSVATWPDAPTTTPEYVADDESAGRGWEEESAKSSIAPAAKRAWVYAEWEKPSNGTYSEITVHMAWKDFVMPPTESAMSSARTPSTRLVLASWQALLGTRLGLNAGDKYLYAVGTARLYDTIPDTKPS